MAGRVGFIGMESNSFANRYFCFGHSDYFKKATSPDRSFMNEFWLPLLLKSAELRRHDDRKIHRLSNLTAFLLNNAEPIKVAGWVLPLMLALGYVNQQRLQATRAATNALCGKLAIESDLLRSEGVDLETPALLAVESMERKPMVENDWAIREVTKLLPRHVWDLKTAEIIDEVIFSPNGQYIATRGSSSISKRSVVRVLDKMHGIEIWSLTRQKDVNAIAFSPDGNLLAIAAADGATNVVRAENGQPILQIQAQGEVKTIMFSSNGRFLAFGGADCVVHIFDMRNRKEMLHFVNGGVVNVVDFSPNGRFLASGSDDHVMRVFDLTSGAQISRLQMEGAIDAVTFSPNGRFLAAGDNGLGEMCHSFSVRILSTGHWNQVARLNVLGSVDALVFSPNSQYVAIGSDDNAVRVLDPLNGKEMWRATLQDGVDSAAFSPDGLYLAVGSEDKTARIFESDRGNEVSRYTAQDDVLAVAFSPDSRHLAIGTLDGLTLLEPNVKDQLELFTDFFSSPEALVAGGRYLILENARSGDRALKDEDEIGQIYDINTGQQLGRFFGKAPLNADPRIRTTNSMSAVATSHDGRYVAVADYEGALSLFDPVKRTVLWSTKEQSRVEAIAFTKNDEYLAVGTFDDEAQLIAVTSGDIVRRIAAPNAAAGLNEVSRVVAFTQDGRWMSVANRPGSITEVYDVASGKVVSRISQEGWADKMQSSPNGQYLAEILESDSDANNQITFRVFETSHGKQMMRFTLNDLANSLTFSPDSRMVAVGGGDDRAVHIFDLSKGVEVNHLTFDMPVLAMEFESVRNGLLTVIGDQDKIIVSRQFLRPQDLINQACSLLTHNLTLDDWGQFIGSETPYHKTCPNVP
jgi:WD40 repeat protein